MPRLMWMKLLVLAALFISVGCQSSQRTSESENAHWLNEWVAVDPSIYDESADVLQRPGYCDRFARNMKVLDRYTRFEKIGVKVFHLTLRGENTEFYSTPYWTDVDTYPKDPVYQDPQPASLEVQAQSILKAVPDARFVIHFFAAPPKPWAVKNPDQIQTGSDGKVYRAASYASQSWLEGQEKMIHNMIRHLESLPWGKQVDGYVVIPHTEGGTELSVYGEPFDQAGAMQQAYVKFVKDKYAADGDLQAAWGDESATLDKIKVPTLAEYDAARKDWMTWPKPQKTQRYRDYFLLQQDLLRNAFDRMAKAVKAAATQPTFVGIDAVKQPLTGWLISDAFSGTGLGMDFPHLLLAAGSTNAATILDLPSIDGFMTPADYTARSTGWGFELEGIADSIILRDKFIYAEDDARSWHKKYSRTTQGAWRNAQEARAGLLRNLAMCASRGLSHYWTNAGDGYFDGDETMEIVHELLPAARVALSVPAAPTEHAIAMILDDEGSLDSDFTSGFSQLAVMQQRVHELALTGLPYRIYLLSDLKRDNFPKFRAYLFPDLFKITPEKMALIQKKVFNNGSIAIFGPATGVASGNERNADDVSKLLGIKMQVVEKTSARRVLIEAGSHPALWGVKNPVVYGDSYEYGPIITPVIDPQEGVTELGRGSIFWGLNTPGLVLRSFGPNADAVMAACAFPPQGPQGPENYTVVFSAATPLPAALLRSLAIYAGCNPWSDLGDVVHASKRVLGVHSAKAGVRTVHLPEASYVTDLVAGLKTAQPVSSFEVTLEGPGSRLYLLDPVSDKK